MATVVVGIDGSAQSLVALRRGIEEASARKAELHVVQVSDVTPAILHLSGNVTINTTDLAEVKRREVWKAAAEIMRTAPPGTRAVDLEGYPADSLVDYCAETKADLLVLGTRGRGRLASTFLGSTSMRSLELAPCDVLIAKPPRE